MKSQPSISDSSVLFLCSRVRLRVVKMQSVKYAKEASRRAEYVPLHFRCRKIVVGVSLAPSAFDVFRFLTLLFPRLADSYAFSSPHVELLLNISLSTSHAA
jgi:hypothetical protein